MEEGDAEKEQWEIGREGEQEETAKEEEEGQELGESANRASGSEMLQVSAAGEVLEAVELLLGLQSFPGSPQSSQENSAWRSWHANG